MAAYEQKAFAEIRAKSIALMRLARAALKGPGGCPTPFPVTKPRPDYSPVLQRALADMEDALSREYIALNLLTAAYQQLRDAYDDYTGAFVCPVPVFCRVL